MGTLENVEQYLSSECGDVGNIQRRLNVFSSQLRIHREVMDKGTIILKSSL